MSLIKTGLRFVPLIGTAGSFAQTAINVYNCTTPSGAIKCAIKRIVLDCTPPLVKYPALCAALMACTVAGVTTGNPLCFSAACTVGEAILDEVL